MKNLFILKGGSAAGKGTRVCQLMEFLKSQNLNVETIRYNFNGKSVVVGKFFPAYGIFIPGKYSVSNKSGLTSWSGVDHLHSAFKKAEDTRNIIKELCEELNVKHLILEGEPMFLSDKYRPEFLSEFYQPDNIYIDYYLYGLDDRAIYDARIKGRSGKTSGDSGWERIKSYHKEIITSREEIEKCEAKTSVAEHNVEEHPYKFVDDTLRSIYAAEGLYHSGMVSTIVKTWCEENPMLRSVDGKDPLNKSSLW